jgi:hypothetical protein
MMRTQIVAVRSDGDVVMEPRMFVAGVLVAAAMAGLLIYVWQFWLVASD